MTDDPDDEPPPRPLLGAGLGLLMGIALAFVIAGLAVARVGPSLFPAP